MGEKKVVDWTALVAWCDSNDIPKSTRGDLYTIMAKADAQHERIVAGLEARLREVLARDALGATDCNCINVSRRTEREYEQGCCPHQRARAFLAQTAEGV